MQQNRAECSRALWPESPQSHSGLASSQRPGAGRSHARGYHIVVGRHVDRVDELADGFGLGGGLGGLRLLLAELEGRHLGAGRPAELLVLLAQRLEVAAQRAVLVVHGVQIEEGHAEAQQHDHGQGGDDGGDDGGGGGGGGGVGAGAGAPLGVAAGGRRAGGGVLYVAGGLVPRLAPPVRAVTAVARALAPGAGRVPTMWWEVGRIEGGARCQVMPGGLLTSSR